MRAQPRFMNAMLENQLDKVTRACLPALRARALNLTRNPDQAADLVQDTFERALRRLSPQLPADRVLGWLCVVMRHIFIDGVRAPESRLRSRSDITLLPHPPTPDEGAPPQWQLVEIEDAHAALDLLPADLKRPYEMHVLANMSYREIEEILDMPLATVGTRIYRARRRLREILSAKIKEGDASVPERVAA